MRSFLILIGITIIVLFGAVVTLAQDANNECTVLKPDGTWEKGVWNGDECQLNTNTPSPTATFTASFTPTSPVTNTPTPRPSDTPEPSPTQEDTRTPTFTPQPTNTPTITPSPTNTPPFDKCWGIVTADALNVRDQPWGVILGQVRRGDQLTFDAVWVQDFAWWRIEFWTPDSSAWVSSNWIEPGDTANCDNLPDITPEQGSQLAVGWFSMPNGNVLEQVESVVVGAARNIVVGTHPYANASTCLQVMDAGGICSFRPGAPDCPPDVFVGNPAQSARDFMRHASFYADGVFQDQRYAGRIWIDVINECDWGNTVDQYAWWAIWFDTYIAEAQARNWPPLQLPSLGPGFGNELMFTTWAGWMQRLYDAGGMFSMHVYNPVDTWLCPFNEWLADRHLHNYQIITALGVDVRMSLTEVGHGWGNTTPNLDDMACWVERTALYDFVEQVHIWETGVNYTWPLANWEGRVVEFIYTLDNSLWR